MHIRRKSTMRHPLRTGPRDRLLEHSVNLFEAQPLGLGDEEVREGERDAAQTAPHEEDVRAEVSLVVARADEIGGDCSDDT